MKVKELIDKYEAAECVVDFVSGKTLLKNIRRDLEQLDEPKSGHADEAPRYLKNILARLRELSEHDREVWLKVIMSEFKQDFSRAKWLEGYEQGKVEGMVEREKIKIPQCVADWIEKCKTFEHFAVSLSFALQPITWEKNNLSNKCIDWLIDASNQETFARAWLDGYEVEEEPKYTVKIKSTKCSTNSLVFSESTGAWFFSVTTYHGVRFKHTRKQLEEADFGWVFDCPGIEIEEVE
ncbi:MAG: DUF1642 domain-containing protein [Streptococcus sp.]|nr:MAG: DUF1642 domain-containing protein [Streptococcus sp.]